MRLKSFDNFLMTAMGLLALYSLFVLYGAKYLRKDKDNEIKVASIVEQIKTVKRKRSFYTSWMDVNQGDSLAQDDEIYTHGQSSAKIDFINGPKVTLFENSLLRIKNQKNGNTLLLDKGNITAKLSADAPKLNITLNGKQYAFESKSANIQVEKGKAENKFILLDGSADLKVGEKKEVLKTDQVLIQDNKTGAVKIKAIPFKLLLPQFNEERYFNDKTAVTFSWKNMTGTPAEILIAKDSEFKTVIRREALDKDEFILVFDDEGTYYWKVVAQNDELGESPIRSFTLKEEKPLDLNLNKTVLYKGINNTEKVFLSWTKTATKKYRLKVESPSGTNEITLSQNSYEFIPKETGIIKFQVKAEDERRPGARWSPVASLEIQEEKAVTLINNNAETIEKITYENKPYVQLISWSGPEDSFTYTVTLELNGKTKSFKTSTTNFPLSLAETGNYNWKVQGTSPSGVATNSLTGKVILKKPLTLNQAPAEGAIIELEKPDQSVSFKWDEVEKETTYEFELSNQPDFSRIILVKEVSTNALSAALGEAGKYYWRVKIKKGKNVEYSRPVSVEIRPTPPLDKPELAPDTKIKLKYIEEKSTWIKILDFFMAGAYAADEIALAEWELPASLRAKKYIVEIYEDNELKNLVTRFETSTPHAQWRNAKPGIFYWRVSYEDFWGRRTEFSKAAMLTMEASEKPIEAPPSPIELQSPKHKADILATKDDKELFSWEEIEGIKTYQLEMASDLDFTTDHSILQVDDIKTTITCDKLKVKSGDHYWKVTTTKGNTSKRRSFHSECAAPPEPEPMPTKIPEATIDELADVIKVKMPLHTLSFFANPYHLSYKNTGTGYTSTVTGNVIDSVKVSYNKPSDFKNFKWTRTILALSRGKVFSNITFTDIDLNLRAALDKENFQWGPTFALLKRTTYVESGSTITGKGVSSLVGGAFIEMNGIAGQMSASAMFGSALYLNAELLLRVKQKYLVGPFFDSLSFSTEGKHSYTRIGINAGYTITFLDNL